MRTVLIAAVALAGTGAVSGTAGAQQRMTMQAPVLQGPVMQGPAMQGPGMQGQAMQSPALQYPSMSDGSMAQDPYPMNGGAMPGASLQGAPTNDGSAMYPSAGQPRHGRRWGGRYQGHWVGGMRAPGGMSSYRQPYRGFALPGYWRSSTFQIGDWSDYGLYQPPVGYSWSRYFDDAVLIDSRGSVHDTIGGIDWPRYDLDEAQGGRLAAYNANVDEYRATAGADYAYPQQNGYGAQQAYANPGAYAQQGYAQPGGYPQQGYTQRRSNGVGGALIGGAAGGIAGGLIAGRHDKVAGALIGAGVGGLAGYAIDRNRRPRDYPVAGGQAAGYSGPGYAGDQGYGASVPGYAQPIIVQSGAGTTVTTSTVGGATGSTYVNGYYYAPATVTTVTVESTPVLTTTTEVFEDSVTYTHRARHKAYRKHVWHRPVCYCRR